MADRGIAGLLPDEIETERLSLRALRIEDAEALVAAIAESFVELHRWMAWAVDVPGVEEERAILARRIHEHEAGSELSYAIWRRRDGAFVGSGGLPRPRRTARAYEIGYWVRTSLVGNGFATEFAAELTRTCFANLDAKRVEIRTSALNTRSRAVAERLGYRLERTLRWDEEHSDGTPRDTIVYAKYAGAPLEDMK